MGTVDGKAFRLESTGLLPLVLVLMLGTACQGSDDSRWATVAPGVEIVANDARSKAPVKWALADSPSRIYRLPEAPEGSPNNWVRFVSLESGGIAAAEESRIILFSPEGAVLNTVGRFGEGPQEFRSTTAICRTRGDTLVVFEFNRHMLHIIDSRSGTFVRSLVTDEGSLPEQGCFEDGTFVLQKIDYDLSTRNRMLTYHRLNLAGQVLDTLLRTELSRSRLRESGYPSQVAAGSSWFFGDRYFSEVREYRLDGGLRRVVRMDEPVVENSVEEQLRSRGIEVAAGDPGVGRARSTARSREPFYGSIVVGTDHRLWVRDDFQLDHPLDIWTVFDTSGTLVGQLRAKPVHGDEEFYVLGFVDDEAMVHHVDVDGNWSLEVYGLVPSTL